MKSIENKEEGSDEESGLGYQNTLVSIRDFLISRIAQTNRALLDHLGFVVGARRRWLW